MTFAYAFIGAVWGFAWGLAALFSVALTHGDRQTQDEAEAVRFCARLALLAPVWPLVVMAGIGKVARLAYGR